MKIISAASRAIKKEKKTDLRLFSLRAVYLREGKEWISDNFDPVLPGQSLFGQFRIAGHNIDVQKGVVNDSDAKPIHSCKITSSFEFRYLDAPPNEEGGADENDKHLVAEISARFTVDYLIETPEIPPQEMLEKWATTDSLLSCWPYWREFCHATLLRMNLPITLMPMMEVNQSKD
ncbi:MAG: hypothetical protein Q8K74_10730 [Candidatus Nitrotoga sp.]|nr:hypothetical protein [Candidatus Nitrotoga sp.]